MEKRHMNVIKAGKREGEWVNLFSNGFVESTGMYKNGAMHGEWTFYNPDGTKKMTQYYENGYPVDLPKEEIKTNMSIESSTESASMRESSITIKGFSDFINEKKGIHPAVRKHLIDFFKKNKKGTFKEAQAYIKTKMKTWKLSKDDYEEAKSLNEAISMGSIMDIKEKLELAYEQLGEIMDMMETQDLPAEYETKAHEICNEVKTLHSTLMGMDMEDSDFPIDEFEPDMGDDMYDDDDDDYLDTSRYPY